MSWPQWPQTSGAVPGWSGAGIAPAPVAAAAAQTVGPLQTPGTPYTPEQWAAMQQQNWQQWVQWQQQYQQWQQQYGEQYQKSMALAGQNTSAVSLLPVPVQPPLPVPDTKTAPPLPLDTTRPPLPPEEPPRNVPATVTAPTFSYNVNVPPPSIPPPPPQQQPSQSQFVTQPPPQKPASQNFGQNRYPNVTQPPSLLSLPISKPSFIENQSSRNQNLKTEFSNKRPGDYSNDNVEDAKKNRWEANISEKKDKKWNQNQTPQRNQQWSENKQVRPNVEELSEAEKSFDKQFEQWEAQFNKWKDQNAGHPDKQQYKEYEAKWEVWRVQLLERREQMRKKRLGILGSPAQSVPSKPASNAPPIGPINPPIVNITQPQAVKLNTEPVDKDISTSPKPNLELPKEKPKEIEAENKNEGNTSDLDISILFSQPPKEQRTNIRQRRASIKSDTESTTDTTSFLKVNMLSGGGIPGLDLVKDDDCKLPDNKEEEQKSEIDPKLPDYEAISKGINSILGDEKLLSMLSMVSQNKKIEPLNTNMQTITPNSNNCGAENLQNNYQSNQSFSDKNFEQNQFNTEYDQNKDNVIHEVIQDEGNTNTNFNLRGHDFNQASNFNLGPHNRGPGNFNQGPANRNSNNFNPGPSNRDSKFGPSNTFGSMNRDLHDSGPQGRGLQNFMGNRNDFNMQNRPPNDFNRGPNNFNQGPPGRGPNFNKGPDFKLGPPNRGEFNQGPPNRGPNNFNAVTPNRGPGEFNPGLGNRSTGDFIQGPSSRGPGEFNQGPLNKGPDFNQGPRNRNQTDFNRGGGDINQTPLNKGSGSLNQGMLNKGPGEVHQVPLNRGQDMSQGPPNRGPGDFLQSQPNRGPINFNQGTMYRGPGDFNQGTPNRGPDFNQGTPNRGPGDFNQGTPNRVPGDFNQGAPNRGPSDFNQGTSNRGPADFNQGISSRGPGDFNQGTPSRGPGDFNQGAPKRGPGDFNQGTPNRGPGDFKQGTPNRGPGDFNQGTPNRGPGDFNQGAPNRGPGDFNQSTPNKGPGDFNQGAPNRGPNNFHQGPQNRGPGAFNQGPPIRGSGDFNQGPPFRGPGFNQGPPNRMPGPPNRRDFNQGFQRGFNDFNQGKNSGPDDFNQGFSNRGFGELNERPINRESTGFNQGPQGRGSGDFGESSQNKGSDDFNQDPPNRETENFNQGPQMMPSEDFNQGSQNKTPDFNQRPDFNQNQVNRGPNFNQGPSDRGSNEINQRPSNRGTWCPRENFNTAARGPVGPGSNNNQSPQFNRDGGPSNREFESMNQHPNTSRDQWNANRSSNQEFSEIPGKLNRSLSNENDRRDQQGPHGINSDFDNSRDFNRSQSERQSEDNFDAERTCPGNTQFPEGRISNPDNFTRGSNDKYWDEALILKPVTVIDYDHKSLNKSDSTFIEPVQTFDYGHTSKNVDKKNNFQPIRNIPPKFQKFTDSNRHYNRDYPPKQLFSSGNREMESTFQRKLYDNRKSQEKYDRYVPKINQFTKKSFEEDKNQYEDIDDYEDDPFEEPDFDKLSQDNEMELEPFVNKPNPNFESDPPLKFKEKTVTMIEDLLVPPGRNSRPPRIVIILRGPPGSGKTFLAKLIKDKEAEHGGSAPRILSLDDYFMVEQDKEIFDKETGRKTTVKEMVYEYEECMELAYRQSLEKAFKKTITDGFFPFIILDCVNDKTKHFAEMWSFAKQNGFQVYVCQMELDVAACTKRNIHHRSEIEIERLVAGWETTPAHYLTLDATSLIQAGCISEVEMEEVPELDDLDQDEEDEEGHVISKWERMEPSGEKLARLDGTSKPLRPRATMEDYLQLDDDIPEEKPGEKRVRWADLEERRRQDKMRAIGFVVGQTDWSRMMDPTQGSSALTQTKYIERVRRF